MPRIAVLTDSHVDEAMDMARSMLDFSWVVVCPDSTEGHTIIGCGSTNVEWDGVDVFDCLDCGIFFAPSAAKLIDPRLA